MGTQNAVEGLRSLGLTFYGKLFADAVDKARARDYPPVSQVSEEALDLIDGKIVVMCEILYERLCFWRVAYIVLHPIWATDIAVGAVCD